MKSDQEFISDLIDENEYLTYIDYLDDYKKTFGSNQKIISIKEFIQNKKQKLEDPKIKIVETLDDEMKEITNDF